GKEEKPIDGNEPEPIGEPPETELESTVEEIDLHEAEEPEELIKTNEKGKEDEQNSIPIESLSEMFEHDKEEEYTKMRLCIVQDHDTIENIAERYDTTANQLILKNRLNDDTVSEGQLLYIPEKMNK